MPDQDSQRMTVEVVEVSPNIVVPSESHGVAGEVFRQLLQQAIRVADQANAQSVRMAADFAEIYRREQVIRNEYEAKLKELRLMERQTTRYAEDLAQMLRNERERREELERALNQERVANEELRRTGLQGISHLLLAATLKDQTTGAHLLRVRRYVEAIAARLGLPTELTARRPYKAAWSVDEGMASIKAGAGAQFDPDVVAAFESLQLDGTIQRIRVEVGSAKID